MIEYPKVALFSPYILVASFALIVIGLGVTVIVFESVISPV